MRNPENTRFLSEDSNVCVFNGQIRRLLAFSTSPTLIPLVTRLTPPPWFLYTEYELFFIYLAEATTAPLEKLSHQNIFLVLQQLPSSSSLYSF